MEKETKDLMNKLKDFEINLIKFKTDNSKDVNFYLKNGLSANTEMFALKATIKIMKAFYSKFPEIKDYKKQI